MIEITILLAMFGTVPKWIGIGIGRVENRRIN